MKTRIVVDERLIEHSDVLYEALKELYLGENQTYQIYVHEKHLARLEKVMDDLIRKHGLKNVGFDYSLMKSFYGETVLQLA